MTMYPAEQTHARFDALGTYAFVAVRRPAALAAAVNIARRVVADVDATCSRFRSDSDLSRANVHAGSWVVVDPLLVAATSAACEAAEQTGGLVHPLLGRTMVQLGYDRDFATLSERTDELPFPWPNPGPGLDDWREIGLCPTGAIRVPAGTALDLGSIGKAWAADMIAVGIEHELCESAIVSLGGDIRVAAPDGRPWRIAISEHPQRSEYAGDSGTVVVRLDEGGLATSSTLVRRWTRHGAALHHLVDPRTGLPAPEVWRTVTATGPTCTAANTASTAAVILGDSASTWLSARGVTARLVDTDGHVATTGGWPASDLFASDERKAS